MKANCWVRPNKVRVENVPDPKILNGPDAIVKVTATAICGSDLHVPGLLPPHRAKQIPGWNLTKPRPGWHQWTTPTGRTYTKEPWRYTA